MIAKNKHNEDVYVSPEELIYNGDQKKSHASINVIDFGPDHYEEKKIKDIKNVDQFADRDSLTWIMYNGLHNVDLIRQLQHEKINTHFLSDILDTTLRPKFHEEDDIFFVSMKILNYNPIKSEITPEHFCLIIVDNCMYTFNEKSTAIFKPLIQEIKRKKKKIVSNNIDYLVYRVLDLITNNYQILLRTLEDEIDDLEDLILSDEEEIEILDQIITYKKLVNELKRYLKPALEAANKLFKFDSEIVLERSEYFYGELVNDLKQAMEMTDAFKEMLSDQLNIYHTTISSKLNNVMMTLTIFSVIFIPLTFITSLYGTNFQLIPELTLKYGYFYMWGIMIFITTSMLYIFKKKKWINF